MSAEKSLLRQPTTLKQLARELHLSVTAVSLALNGRGRTVGLSETTIARILNHARQAGYTPDPRARSLRLRRSDIVGIVFPHLRNNWAHDILEGMHDLLEARGLVPFLANHRDDPNREVAEVASLLQRQAAGILCNPLEQSRAVYRHVLDRGVPLVFFGDTLDDLPEAAYAAWDPSAVGLAVRHLLDVGCRRVAFLGSRDERFLTRKRTEAYRTTLAEAGRPAPSEWVLQPRRAEAIPRLLRALFRRKPSPDALFCLYNDAALQAADVLRAIGLRVPRDVCLATLADAPLCGPRAYDITVVTAPIREEGREAARILLERIDHPDATPIHRLVPGGELIPRGSTRRRRG